ncbi:unnamed protein product [Mycena citricolor]|uniref:Uncharacterized protein n=1 Tax=Mycena citricolor TaxID=2018698 RepID=A0AAD2I171_9AGAR|nr:unnamed protein product [Mycena citricolor]
MFCAGQPKFRSMWERYCHGVDAIVFVVDSADASAAPPEKFNTARFELHQLLGQPTLNAVPLLVLGNKNDLGNHVPVKDLIKDLQLDKITDRPVSNLLALADPPARQVDGAVMDYFMIELVNALRASAAVATERSKKIEAEMVEAGLIPPALSGPTPHSLKRDATARDSVTSVNSRASTGGRVSGADEGEEAVRQRLEAIGIHVGANFTESFKPVTRISSWEGRADAIRRAKLYVTLPAGIIRGAQSRLGYQTTVSPEITSLPQCTFQVKLPKGA